MIQLATCVSPSHLEHFNLFLTTIGEFGSIDVTWMPQVSKTSHTWGGKGWTAQLRRKAHAMQDAALRNKKEFMLWSDVDVVFLQPCVDRLIELMNAGEGYDLLGQATGTGTLCAGFYIARMTDKLHHLLDTIVKDSAAYKNPAGDQYAMNKHRGLVKWGELPVEEFWTPGWRGPPATARPRRVRRGFPPGWGLWGACKNVNTPATARVTHANFCKGPKIKLLGMQISLKQSAVHRAAEKEGTA